MDKKRLFSFSQITVTPTGEELEALFSQEPLKTAETLLVNSAWYKDAVEECMKDYAMELALVGGYLEWGVMNLNLDEYMHLSINVIRSHCLNLAFQEFIKKDRDIKETTKRLLEDKAFVLEIIDNISIALKQQARQMTSKALRDYNWFCEKANAYVS